MSELYVKCGEGRGQHFHAMDLLEEMRALGYDKDELLPVHEELAESYLDLVREAVGSSLPTKVMELRRELRGAQGPFKDLRRLGQVRKKMQETQGFEEVHRSVHEKLTARYEEIKSALRSEDALAQLERRAGKNKENPALTLWGVAAYRPSYSRNELVDAIVAATWVKMVGGTTSGSFICLSTQTLAEAVERSPMSRIEGSWSGRVAVEADEDVDTLVETIAGLWSPEGAGELKGFTEAVNAARILLKK